MIFPQRRMYFAFFFKANLYISTLLHSKIWISCRFSLHQSPGRIARILLLLPGGREHIRWKQVLEAPPQFQCLVSKYHIVYRKKSSAFSLEISKMRIGLSDPKDAFGNPSWYSLLCRISLEILEIPSIEQQIRDELLEMLMQIFISLFDILQLRNDEVAHYKFQNNDCKI